MKKSDEIKNLAKALMLFNIKMQPIKKDANNPFFKSKYATLSNILDNIHTPLIEAGLVFSQCPTNENELTTIIIHVESGEYMESVYKINPVKTDPQALGSAITYARRYALAAILGLNIEDDDDGNAASGKTEQQKPWLNEGTTAFKSAYDAIRNGNYTIIDIKKKYQISKETELKLIS